MPSEALTRVNHIKKPQITHCSIFETSGENFMKFKRALVLGVVNPCDFLSSSIEPKITETSNFSDTKAS